MAVEIFFMTKFSRKNVPDVGIDLGTAIRGPIKPNFDLIRTLMIALNTCKNEEDPIINKSARVLTTFTPIISLWGFFQTLKDS